MDRRNFLKTAAVLSAGALLPKGAAMAWAGETPPPASRRDGIRNAVAGMAYRPIGKTGVMVSPLGFGMMRLPMLPDGGIDEEQSKQMLRYAIDRGMNYVDTSYVYMGGKSEEITGRILRDGYREKVHVATKAPCWAMKTADDFDRILDEQRERLQVDVIDFYLLHAITNTSWPGVVRELGLVRKIEQAKERGKVRHIGFSLHAKLPVFKEVVDSTPNWEFCQLQLNYLDAEYEAGLAGAKYAADRGLGVIAMEPLMGGYLADVPAEVQAIFDAGPAKRSPVEWAFDYLWDMPDIGVVLSGMSTMQHMVDNMDYAARARVGMLTTDERQVIGKVVDRFARYDGVVPCTGCELCHPCPHNVAIAQSFKHYNQYRVTGQPRWRDRYLNLPGTYGVNAHRCVGCGQCEPKCPAGIPIRERFEEIRETIKA